MRIHKTVSARYHYLSYAIFCADLLASMAMYSMLFRIQFGYLFVVIPLSVAIVCVSVRKRYPQPESYLKAMIILIANCLVSLSVIVLL